MLLVHAVDLLWIYSSWGPGRLQWTISSPSGNHPKSPVQVAPQWPACRRVGSAVPNWHPLVDTREAGCLGAKQLMAWSNAKVWSRWRLDQQRWRYETLRHFVVWWSIPWMTPRPVWRCRLPTWQPTFWTKNRHLSSHWSLPNASPFHSWCRRKQPKKKSTKSRLKYINGHRK